MVQQAIALVAINNLNNSIGKCNIEQKYPILITKEKTAECWWDNLQSDIERLEVANIAFDYYRFSSNYCWDNRGTKFKFLKSSQKEHIKFAFKQRGFQWEAFPLKSIIK